LNKLSSRIDLLNVTRAHTLDLAEVLLGPNCLYGFEAGNAQLTSNVAFIEPEATAVPGGTVETAINVREVYAQLARDLHDGAYTTPEFDHALAAKWGERRRPEARTDRTAP
jgi:hypothetical protein